MAEDESSEQQIRKLAEHVKRLENMLREQTARLYALEQHFGLTYRFNQPEAPKPAYPPESVLRPPAPPVETPPQPTISGEPRTPPPPTVHPQSPRIQPPYAQPPFPPPPRPQTPPPSGAQARARGSLENRIGGRLLLWIGILAIAFGVAFFLKLAFENEWIGPTGRVMIGVVIGLGFLIGAERLRARYPAYAYGLTGGGILILYMSFFASSARYELIPRPVAFLLMALVTATAALLAARYNALAIAILGLIGGFLTPVLLSTGVDNEAGLFGYIALLDLGVLALAYSKHWRSLNYLAFSATVLMFAAWMFTWYEPYKLWTTFGFLTLFFAIFALLAVLYNVINRRPTGWFDLALVFLNALIYFFTSYDLLDDRYRAYLGLFAVLVAAFYLALGYFAYERDRQDKLLVYTFIGLAVLFLVLAVPIQFHQRWVTIGWAVEGAVMTWVGLRAKDQTSRVAALVVFLIGVTHWLLIDVSDYGYPSNADFTPFLNSRALSAAVLIVALAAAALFYKRYQSEVKEKEDAIFPSIYILAANLLAVTLLSLDVNDYFEKAIAASAGQSTQEIIRAQIDSTRQFALTTLWIVYAGMAMFIGFLRGQMLVRVSALILLGLAALKAVLIDLQYYDAQWHTPVLNQTFAVFALLVLAIATGAWFYDKAENVGDEERSVASQLLIVAGNLLAVIALSAEALGYYDVKIARGDIIANNVRDLSLARQLSLSVIWALYAGGMLVTGILREKLALRVMALLLFGLTIAKVFFIDLASLDRIYRIISFIVLGAILLAVSFLYQRFRQQTEAADAAAESDA